MQDSKLVPSHSTVPILKRPPVLIRGLQSPVIRECGTRPGGQMRLTPREIDKLLLHQAGGAGQGVQKPRYQAQLPGGNRTDQL